MIDRAARANYEKQAGLKPRAIMASLLSLFLIGTNASCFSAHSDQQRASIAKDSNTSPPCSTCRTIHTLKVGAGLACSVDGNVGPTSYAVSTAGRPGFPHVTEKDLITLRAITKSLGSRNIRYVFLDERFVVFDASPGLCSGRVPLTVLNGRCGEFYANTDRPFETVGGGDMANLNTPFPWNKHC